MSTWDDQPFLDAAADEARHIAGEAYYTGCIIHQPGPGRVTLYLANAPDAILDELEALHPGVYAIINDAPRPESVVREIIDTLKIHELKAAGIDAVWIGGTGDGLVGVGVLSPFIWEAQARFDAIYGCGVVRVYQAQRAYALARRTAVSAPAK